VTVSSWYSHLALTYLISQVAGSVVGGVRWRRIGLPERFATLWLGIAALAGIGEQILRVTHHNSQLAAHLWFAPSGAVALWIAAAIAKDRRGGHLWRVIAMGYLGAIAILLVGAETPAEYSPYAGAFHGVVLLGVGGLSLTYRARRARGSLWYDAGFLIAAGMMMIGGPTTFLALTSRAIGATDRETVRALYAMRLVMALIGQCFMIRALLPMPRRSRELIV
jgi:hypothetical protein